MIQDADGEYDPADVPALIEPILRGKADVVFGSRLQGGKPQRAYLFWHLVGNRMLSLLTNVLFNTTISDMETGYKAFRTDVLRSLDLQSDDFGIEPEITAKVCKRKLRIYELPVAYYGRTYEEGKKITWRDGFKAIRVLFEVRVRQLGCAGGAAAAGAAAGLQNRSGVATPRWVGSTPAPLRCVKIRSVEREAKDYERRASRIAHPPKTAQDRLFVARAGAQLAHGGS